MLALVALGTVLNYLARASLAVSAPTLATTLHITTRQYSWVVMTFQGAYAAMQPVAGAVLDRLGTRLGLTIFAVAWGFVTMFHAFARDWRGLAATRGLLGVSEAAAVPAGIRVVSAWFAPRQRSVATGWFTISSIGNIIAPAFVTFCILWWGWRSAFVVTGLLSLAWAVLWWTTYRDPAEHRALPDAQRRELFAAQALEAGLDEAIPNRLAILRSRRFASLAVPRFFAEPTWQTLNFFIPLYLVSTWHVGLGFIATWAWLPFVGADVGVVFAGYMSPFLMRHAHMPLLTSRKVVACTGAAGMIFVAFMGMAGRPDVAMALFCVGAFMHQMLAGMLVTLTADLFPDKVVGTAAGMAGCASWTGGLIFTGVVGGLADAVGYAPLFVLLAALDILSAILLCVLLPAPLPTTPRRPPKLATS